MRQRPNPSYQNVARRIEALILDRTLPQGSKLPSERQLAGRLNVSRPVVREALKELSGKGVIDTEQGRGSFVSDMLPNAATRGPLQHLFKDHTRAVYDLLEVRELLEGQSAYYAALRGTTADRYQITKAFEAMERPHPDDTEEDAKLDHKFHKAISEASHNPFLVFTLQSLSQLLLDSVLASVNNLYHRPEQRKMISSHHRQIYEAIINQEPSDAQNAATTHIREIRRSLESIEREEQRLIRARDWAGVVDKQPDLDT